MKWMIASDIHGSAYYCQKLMEAFERERADRLLLLGDILYHGPRNELPQAYDPKRVAALLNEKRQQIVCVRGNCDAEVDQMLLEFPIMAEYCLVCEGDRMIFATHGHVFNPATPPALQPGDILLNGHTHVPADQNMGAYTYMNPGSVSLPKENSARGFIVMENGVFTFGTLD